MFFFEWYFVQSDSLYDDVCGQWFKVIGCQGETLAAHRLVLSIRRLSVVHHLTTPPSLSVHILALSARDTVNWLAARWLFATDDVPGFSSQNCPCCKMARQRCDGMWTTTPKSSLFCPLCVSVATVSYHLEVPHPSVPSNGFSPLSCSFDFGLPCFFSFVLFST